MGDTRKEYYIYVQGEQIAVSHDIYKAYYKEYDHESYLDKRSRKREISFDLLQEQGCAIKYTAMSNHSLEDWMMEQERIVHLYEALGQLDAEERWLVEKLYFNEYPEKRVAFILGVSRQAVNKRKQKILQKLRDILK